MIGESVSRSRVDEIERTEIPGLFDLHLEDGTVLRDMGQSVTQQIVDRNGLVPHLAVPPLSERPSG